MPYVYYGRSQVYVTFIDVEWVPCVNPDTSPVCVDSTNGAAVLDSLEEIIPIISSQDTVVSNLHPCWYCSGLQV